MRHALGSLACESEPDSGGNRRSLFVFSNTGEGPKALAVAETEPCVCVTGILWINNKDKLVVAGFTPGSQAKQAGVLCGDILRKVDGQDVLKMKSEVHA